MPEGGAGGGAGTGTQGGGTGGAGSGGGSGGGDGGDRQRRGPRVKQRRRHYEPPTELVDTLIHKYGSRDRAIEELARQTYDLREDRREIEEELEQVKTQIAPKDAVVLTGDDKKKWDAVKAIELPGDKIVERVKLSTTLEDEKKKTELSTKRKAVATAAGMNGDVLDPLLDQFQLEVETREVQIQDSATGKTTPKQVAHVRKSGDANAAWEKLSDFVARDGSPLKPFAAALAVKSGTSGTGGTSGAGGQQGGTSVAFPDQQGGGTGGGGTSAVDEILKRNKERADRPNPLRAPSAKGGAAA